MPSARAVSHHRAAKTGAWARRNWVSLVLVLVSLCYGGAVTILHEDTLSPIDEVVYLDYTYKVWDQGMVHKGERFGDDVAQLVACEQVLPFGNLGQVCGSDDVNYGGLPNGGYTTGEGYTPLYFWTVRAIGDPLHALTGLSEVTSWRLSGVVWLSMTMLVLVALLRRFRIPSPVILALGLLFIGSPYAWWTYTYISTDTSVVLFGAAILLTTLQARRGRWSAWWLVPLGVLAPLFKITNLLAFGLVGLVLLLDAVAKKLSHRTTRATAFAPVETGAEPKPARFWVPMGISVALAAGLQVLWMRLIPVLAVSDVVVDQGVTVPLTPAELVRIATIGFSGAIEHNPFAARSGSALLPLVFQPLGWLMIAFVIGALVSVRWSHPRGPLVWAIGLACVLALPALGLLMWFLTGTYFPLPGRYAAALIPAVLLLGGFMMKGRLATVFVTAYAGLLMVTGLAIAIQVGASY